MKWSYFKVHSTLLFKQIKWQKQEMEECRRFGVINHAFHLPSNCCFSHPLLLYSTICVSEEQGALCPLALSAAIAMV